MTKQKHTEGPWFADAHGRIWRRPPSDLFENGGGVAGDKPLAFVVAGWAGEGVTGYPVEDNARLIAAAPDLLEALIELADTGAEAWGEDRPCVRWAYAAIANATGGSND